MPLNYKKIRRTPYFQYCHDDSETTEDTFDVKGHDIAGHVTDDLPIAITINPVNDHQVKFRDGLQVHPSFKGNTNKLFHVIFPEKTVMLNIFVFLKM